MLGLWSLYWESILAGSLAAMVLSAIGCQILARQRALEWLCIGQSSSLGVLVGLALAASLWPSQESSSFLPYLASLLCSAWVAWVAYQVEAVASYKAPAILVSLYCLLLACFHLTSSLLPGLESHKTQVFFGDLATLSQNLGRIVIFASLGVGALLLAWFRKMTLRSFDLQLLGRSTAMAGSPNLARVAVEALIFGFICLGIQTLGLLFTLAMMFIPSTMVSLSAKASFGRHLGSVLFSAALGSALGFLFSLEYSRLPTVPCLIIGVLLVSGLLTLLIENENQLL